ncbi:hypothetical protein L6452_13283 [Arctium lappa]|uniref:Uncharacterized protein n=1 Tax=Arctium lappa TaxID=4217 RepID=A0ACB9CHV7_ARCLA|nr:hypothetical protein L6452_13283 [Arctium lappa]
MVVSNTTRKKLDTRFPAARIKKIMQADEDVGNIAMAVPLLVSKALELFLQDLCDRTYEITLQRGAKTLNSMHLKQCVQSFNVFDFLREIVDRVPDLGGSDAAGEDRSATKRRKVADDTNNDDDEDLKRDKPPETVHANGSAASSYEKHEGDPNKQNPILDSVEDANSRENHNISATGKTEEQVKVRNFDLNLDLDENGDTPAGSSPKPPTIEMTSDVEKMAIDPVQLANINSRVDEDPRTGYVICFLV